MNKKKLLFLITSLILILVICFIIYFVFIKEDKKKDSKDNIPNIDEIEDIIDVTDKFDSTSGILKIDKDVEGLYDQYINSDFSLKKSIDGCKIPTSEKLCGVTVKIENGEIIYKANNKTVKIDNIENPISLRLGFEVAGGASDIHYNPLYVLNDKKELYKVEVNEDKVNLIEKIEENVDSFDFVEGNRMLLTGSAGENLIIITKSGEDIKINGILMEEYNEIMLYDNEIGFIAKLGNNFVKYNGNDLVVKAVLNSSEKNHETYIISNDNDVFIVDINNKISKKKEKFQSLEIKDNKAIIKYENSVEEINLNLDYAYSYYNGKIYGIK